MEVIHRGILGEENIQKEVEKVIKLLNDKEIPSLLNLPRLKSQGSKIFKNI